MIVPDLRGYGESGKPKDGKRHENYSFRAMAQDQVDVMRHYGHERFLVAAHDRGARVTRRLCLDHPKSVEKACLMDIAPPPPRRLLAKRSTKYVLAKSLHPYVFCCGKVTACLTGISNPTRLDEQRMAFGSSARTVFGAFGDHIHLSGPQAN